MFLQTAFYTRNCVHVGNQTFNSSYCTSGTQRLSKKHETSGGVLLGIHSLLNSHRITVASGAESVAAKILSGKQSIVFGSFYRPPSNDQAYMDRLTEAITCLCKSDPKATYWIADDADLPNIDWFIDQVTHHHRHTSAITSNQGYLHVINVLHPTSYYRNPQPGHILPIALFAALHLPSGTL